MNLQQLTAILGAIILILLGIIGYLLTNNQSVPIDENELTQLVLDYDAEPIQTLNQDVIKTMVEGYRNNQLNTINSNLGMNDAYSVRFDLEDLKKFIYHTEMNVRGENETIENEILGIRFYYASYPREDDTTSTGWNQFKNLPQFAENPLNDEYAGHHTLIMVPTIRNAEGTDVDFDATQSSSSVFTLDNGYLQSLTGATPISAANHGSLFPPM